MQQQKFYNSGYIFWYCMCFIAFLKPQVKQTLNSLCKKSQQFRGFARKLWDSAGFSK